MNCKQVARDLGLNECVIGYVSIECIDDPVSIAVRRMDRDVANITLSIGIPSDIQPKSSLAFTISGDCNNRLTTFANATWVSAASDTKSWTSSLVGGSPVSQGWLGE